MCFEEGGNLGVANGGIGIAEPKMLEVGLTCPKCGAQGISCTFKLLLHLDRMHSKPYTCLICEVEFVDRYCRKVCNVKERDQTL